MKVAVDGFQGAVVPAHDTGMQFCDAVDSVPYVFLTFLLTFWQAASNLKSGRDEQQDANNKRK
jgi:hypothetical protein